MKFYLGILVLVFVVGSLIFIFFTVYDVAKEDKDENLQNYDIRENKNIKQSNKTNEVIVKEKSTIQVEQNILKNKNEDALPPKIPNETTSHNEIVVDQTVKTVPINPQGVEKENEKSTDTLSNKKNISINELDFVDESGANLFNGKKILLKQGLVNLNDEDRVVLETDDKGGWNITLLSNHLIVDNNINKFNTIDSFPIKENALKSVTTIILSKYSYISITLKYKVNDTPIPDGTVCELSSYASISITGIVQGGVAVFKTQMIGKYNAENFQAGTHCKDFSHEVPLLRGEICKFDLEVENGKEQTLQLTDSRHNPVENYNVIFYRDRVDSHTTRWVQDDFLANHGKLNLRKNHVITDKVGKGKLDLLPNGNYVCFIIGKDHTEHFVNVTVDDDRKQLDLTLPDIEGKTLTLKANFKNEPYLGVLNFTYFDMNKYGDHNTKKKGQIIAGQAEIKSLKESKYQFELFTDDFKREIVIFDFTVTNHIYHVFDLITSDAFLHGTIKDKAGNPLEGIEITLSPDKLTNDSTRIEIKTNKDGYFKFGGLDNDRKYVFFVSSEHPRPKDLPQSIAPSPTEVNIVLDDVISFNCEVLDLKGKPVPEFAFSISVYEDKNLKHIYIGSMKLQGENGKFNYNTREYGYYDIKIEIPNSPNIHRLIPILNAEDNVLQTLQVEKGFSLIGTVTDFEGKLVEGASLTRFKYSSPFFTQIYYEITKTDINGHFQLDNCLIGENYCVAKLGYAPISIVTKEEDKTIPLNLSFVKTYQLSGTLLSSDKTPYVQIQMDGNLKTNKSYAIQTYTKPDGSFLISTITPGDWYIYFNVGKGGKRPGQWVKIVDKDEVVNIVYDIPK